MSMPDEKTQRELKLRLAAEAQCATASQASMPGAETAPLLASDAPARPVEALLHELHVHEIELEMQNEALRQATLALAQSRDRYVDLYEFAPVGYLTLTPDGIIAEINLTGVKLLAVERKNVLHRQFSSLVVEDDLACWNRHFASLQGGEPGMVELSLQRGDGSVFHARLDCSLPKDDGVRIALSDIGAQKKAQAELLESEEQLRQLSNFLQLVREEDRTHVARELHDELGQNLTALRIDFNLLARELASEKPTVIARLAEIDRMIHGTVDAVRRICEDLRPGVLDDLGLEAALEVYVKRFSRQYGVACDLELEREDFALTEPTSTAIFRIVQESLTNIARHARATNVMVALQECGEELLLTIADDGCGLPAPLTGERRMNHGLLGMRERVHMLGGRMVIDSASGRGTHIEVSIPRKRKVAP